MTFNKFLAMACGACALVLTTAAPALAQQDPMRQTEQVDPGQERSSADRERPNRRDRAPREQTPEQAKAAVEAAFSATGVTCQVTETKHLGQNEERQMLYEAACANAQGYIVLASTPPQVFDCLVLAATAERVRAEDPAAPAGQLCALPANQNGLELAKAWAQQAGVSCTVDQAMPIGKSPEGNLVHEIGCTGAEGYLLEQTGGVWKAQPCLEVVAAGRTCQFTSADEQAAGYTAKLASTAASDCAVSQVRLMGQNANGRFAEVKCAAEGQGYVLRMDQSGAVQQVYACAIAQRIGGGCTLTAAAAAPAAAPATEQ